MNKTVIIFGIVSLMLIGSVFAVSPFNSGWQRQIGNKPSFDWRANTNDIDLGLVKGSCEWLRPATLYREEKWFSGILGRLSDGSLTCFTPSKREESKPLVKETVVNTPEPEPEPEVDCDTITRRRCVMQSFNEERSRWVCEERQSYELEVCDNESWQFKCNAWELNDEETERTRTCEFQND